MAEIKCCLFLENGDKQFLTVPYTKEELEQILQSLKDEGKITGYMYLVPRKDGE